MTPSPLASSALIKKLTSCKYLVLFKPMHDEADPRTWIAKTGSLTVEKLFVSSQRVCDPWGEAQRINATCGHQSTLIFLPGRRFDLHGTRHGRGGGWYDRFLSRVSPDYIRVGVGHKDHLSSTPLLRQTWDEPVDWLLLQDEPHWIVSQTHAR